MTTERIVLVGTIWAVLLLVLLVMRELLRATRLRSQSRIVPVLDRLVVVMIVAFAVSAVIRLDNLVSGPNASGSPAPSATTIAVASPSLLASGSASPTGVASASPSETPSGTPLPSAASPSPVPTPAPTPPPTPVPTAPPTEPPSPVPTPTAEVSASPTVLATPSPSPNQGAGQVTLPATFRAYDVSRNTATGFHDVQASAGETARATAPQSYAFPTFSNPRGTIRLVTLLSGPYAGTYVSPDDPGVSYTPGG